MARRIVKLKVTEGSVVPAGANQRAHIRLFKMHTHDEKPQPKASFWSRVTRPFAKKKEQDMTSKLEEIKKRIADRRAKMAKQNQTPTVDVNKGRSEARARLQKRLAEIRKRRDERIAKRNDNRQSVSERIAKLREQRHESEVTELRKQLNEERTIRLRKEFIAKAKLIHVAGKATVNDVADVLLDLTKVAPKLADRVEKMLTDTGRAWQAAAKQLTTEIGSDNDSTASSEYQQLQALAKQYKEKDDKLTDEQAFVVAMDKNPELARRLR